MGSSNPPRKLRMRFRLKRIVLVGDRGMITPGGHCHTRQE